MKTSFNYEAETSETISMCKTIDNIVNKFATEPEPATTANNTAEVQPQPEANNFDKFLALLPILIEGAKEILPILFPNKGKDKGRGLIKLPNNVVCHIADEVMTENLTPEQYSTLQSWLDKDDSDNGENNGENDSKADGNDIEPAPEPEK